MLARMRSAFLVCAARFAPAVPFASLADAERSHRLLIVIPVAWGPSMVAMVPLREEILGYTYDLTRPVERQAEIFRRHIHPIREA
ncbi:MAG: hypothetical protein SGPRY_013179, partial [Prymnesium sp.]